MLINWKSIYNRLPITSSKAGKFNHRDINNLKLTLQALPKRRQMASTAPWLFKWTADQLKLKNPWRRWTMIQYRRKGRIHFQSTQHRIQITYTWEERKNTMSEDPSCLPQSSQEISTSSLKCNLCIQMMMFRRGSNRKRTTILKWISLLYRWLMPMAPACRVQKRPLERISTPCPRSSKKAQIEWKEDRQRRARRRLSISPRFLMSRISTPQTWHSLN